MSIIHFFRDAGSSPYSAVGVVSHGLWQMGRGRTPSSLYIKDGCRYYNRSAFYTAARDIAESYPNTYGSYLEYLRAMFLCLRAFPNEVCTVFDEGGTRRIFVTGEELLARIMLEERKCL